MAIRHTARGDYLTDVPITTRLRLVLVDRKLLGRNTPKEILSMIEEGHRKRHPAIPTKQETWTQPQILYGYARDNETQAVVALLPGPEPYQMDMWEVSRAKPFAYADTNNPFGPLPGSYFLDAAAIEPLFGHPPPGRYEGQELKESLFKGKGQMDYERMMRKATKDEHQFMEEEEEKDFESKDQLQYGNLAQELIDLLRHHARMTCRYQEDSHLSDQNINGYLTPVCRMKEDWPYAKWTFYVENVMQAFSGLLRCRYMETWAKQRFPPDRPKFPQEEEGKILTVKARYFLAYHIVEALGPAKEIVMEIEPKLGFVFLPHYWFKNLWLEVGLAVAGGQKHYEKRPPTGLVKAPPAPIKEGGRTTRNEVERIEIFLPIWMVPPIYKHFNDSRTADPAKYRDSFYVTIDKLNKKYLLEGPAVHIHWNLQTPIDYNNFPLLKEAALRGVLGQQTWTGRKKEVKLKSQLFLPLAGEAFRYSLGRLSRDAFPQYWPLTTSQALNHLDMYKAVTMASMKEVFSQLPHDDIAIRLHAPASLMSRPDCIPDPKEG